MSGGLAILCSGQGAQHGAMFELARSDARAASLLDDWLQTFALADPAQGAQHLFANRHAQPLIVAATLASWEALRGSMPPPLLVAGYSIGELAAYGVAGALEPERAIALALCRAGLMDGCAQPAQSLLALSGLRREQLAPLLTAQQFYIAIENGDDAFVVGGLKGGEAALEQAVAAAGGRVTRLAVEVASHTPLMAAARHPFLDALRRGPFGAPRIPVLSGIDARPVRQADEAHAALADQLTQPILWRNCMDACAEAGVTTALELGPGHALSAMLRARHPQIECRSVDEFRTLAGVKKWLARRRDESA